MQGVCFAGSQPGFNPGTSYEISNSTRSGPCMESQEYVWSITKKVAQKQNGNKKTLRFFFIRCAYTSEQLEDKNGLIFRMEFLYY